MKTLIKNPWIVTMNAGYDIIRGGYVLIEGDTIREVGGGAQRMEEIGRASCRERV